MNDEEEWTDVKVAGHPKKLLFSPGVSRCGDIEDGVAFTFVGEGCWVVPYAELLRITLLAAVARNK